MPPETDPHDAPPRYQPLSRRRRLLLLGLAVATALVVIWLMLRPQLRLLEAYASLPSPAAYGGEQEALTKLCMRAVR